MATVCLEALRGRFLLGEIDLVTQTQGHSLWERLGRIRNNLTPYKEVRTVIGIAVPYKIHQDAQIYSFTEPETGLGPVYQKHLMAQFASFDSDQSR